MLSHNPLSPISPSISNTRSNYYYVHICRGVIALLPSPPSLSRSLSICLSIYPVSYTHLDVYKRQLIGLEEGRKHGKQFKHCREQKRIDNSREENNNK